MKLRKVISLLLAATIGATMISGCGSKKESDSGSVTLKWIMAGQGMQQDSQKVWDLFNEKLQEHMPGVTVQFDPVTFADFAEKWQLACAAGEEADLVWTGYAFNIPEQVQKGAYMEIGSLLDEYAPDLKAELPQWAWDLGSYNGQIYVMPIMQQFASSAALMAPKELVDGYMDRKKLVEVNSTSMFGSSQEAFDVLDDWLAKLNEAGKLGIGVYPDYVAQSRHAVNDKAIWDSPALNVFCKMGEDGKFEIYNDCEMPGVKLMYKNMADWYQKGYITPDILTKNDMDSWVGKENGIVLTTTQVLKGEQERKSEQYGMEVDLIPLNAETTYRILNGGCKTGIAIPQTSQHPKEAIQLLELLNTEKGKELLNLLIYGIEGEHYEVVGENRIKTFDYSGSSPKSNSKYGIDKWAVGNTYYSYETEDVPEGWNAYVKELNEEASKNLSPIMGFSFNQDPVKVELAQIQAIKNQYEPVLINGAKGSEWESYFNEMVTKLDNAGQEKVRLEVEKQLNEWLKAKNTK